MALMKTSNPALNDNTFRGGPGAIYGGWAGATERMTLGGTINKTGVLLLLALASASFTWYQFLNTQNAGSVGRLMMLGLIGGFVLAMVTIFKQTWAPSPRRSTRCSKASSSAASPPCLRSATTASRSRRSA